MLTSQLVFVVVSACLVSMATSCCLPRKFVLSELFVVGSSYQGKGSLSKGVARIAVDSGRQMVGMYINAWQDGKNVSERFIEDFSKNKGYLIQDGRCTVVKIGKWVKPCIPAEAKALGKTYFGEKGNAFNLQNYEYQSPGPIMTYFSVNQDRQECLLATEVSVGQQRGVGFTATMQYVDFSRKVDEGIFEIPSYCPTEVVVPKEFMKPKALAQSALLQLELGLL